MSTPPITQQGDVFYNCRLGRNELDRLFAIAAEGTAPGSVRLSTYVNGTTTRFEEPTLGDLIAKRTASYLVGPNDPWDSLKFSASDLSAGRNVQLDMTVGKVELSVHGPDAIWVYGQYARLKSFLKAWGEPNTPTAMGGRCGQKLS